MRDGGAMTDEKAPTLLLGPMLRHVDTTTATVWVETSHNATVEVRSHGRTASTGTFTVEGHHFALVLLDGLEPATESTYEVAIDGRVVWPLADDPRPAPIIRTLPDHAQTPTHDLDIVFGSCRVDRPHETPWNLAPEEHPDGVGVDALSALSDDCQTRRRRLPDLLLMLGDQVYADEGLSPGCASGRSSGAGRDSEPTDEVWTSRSTPGSTATAGRTPTCAGCSRRSRPRWSSTTTTCATTGTPPRPGGGGPAPAVVARADRRGVHVLLGVPAPGQSLPGRPGPRRPAAKVVDAEDGGAISARVRRARRR